jgi:hypothetical protein
MKNCATGVSVRFFSVMIPIGQGVTGRSTGKTLSRGDVEPNFNTEAENTPRNGPRATRSRVTEGGPHTALLGGNLAPRSWNALLIDGPIIVSSRGSAQGSFAKSESLIFRCQAHFDRDPAAMTLAVTATGDENMRAFACEPICCRHPDAAIATGDERDLSFELTHLSSLPGRVRLVGNPTQESNAGRIGAFQIGPIASLPDQARDHLFHFSLRSLWTAKLGGFRTLIPTGHGPD